MPNIGDMLKAIDKIKNEDSDTGGMSISSSEGTISNLANHIMFYAEITQNSSVHLNCFLGKLMRENLGKASTENREVDPIYLHLNSPGGSIFESMLIYDVINEINTKVPIITIAEGQTSSGATIILMSGKKRFATPSSMLLLHELSTCVFGNFTQLSNEMRNIQKLENKLEEIYLKHTKIKKEEIRDFLHHEQLLDANDALNLGIIDEIKTVVI